MRKLLWASSDWQQEVIQRRTSHRLHRGLGYHTGCASRSRPTQGTTSNKVATDQPWKAAYSRQCTPTSMFSDKVAMQPQACKLTSNLHDARQSRRAIAQISSSAVAGHLFYVYKCVYTSCRHETMTNTAGAMQSHIHVVSLQACGSRINETWQMHRPWQILCFAAFEFGNGHVWQLNINSDMVNYFVTYQ